MEISFLIEQLSAMADHVVEAFGRSLSAFRERNAVMAQQVIDSDTDLNSMEVELDSAVLEAMGSVASEDEDLRGLLAIKTAAQALERIGDHAVNIAEAVVSIARRDEAPFAIQQLDRMAELTRQMLSDALSSFLGNDAVKASNVLTRDEEIDSLNSAMSEQAKNLVMHENASFDTVMDILRISRNLERIADLSTNIAEEAIFRSKGIVVKHATRKPLPGSSLRRAT